MCSSYSRLTNTSTRPARGIVSGRKENKMKECTIKLSYRTSMWVTEEMSTQDPIQATMKLAGIAQGVKYSMSPNHWPQFEYKLSMSVKDIPESKRRSPAIGVWYDCKLNGEPCDPKKLFSYGGHIPDGETAPGPGEQPHAHTAAIPVYKVGGRLFETWCDVLDEYPVQ